MPKWFIHFIIVLNDPELSNFSEIFQLQLVRNLKYLINFIIAFKHFLINFLIVSFESGVMHLDTSIKILKANIALSREYFLFAAKLSVIILSAWWQFTIQWWRNIYRWWKPTLQNDGLHYVCHFTLIIMMVKYSRIDKNFSEIIKLNFKNLINFIIGQQWSYTFVSIFTIVKVSVALSTTPLVH